MAKRSLKQFFKDKFDWDVTALEPYTDEQSQEYIEDLIFSSDFINKMNVQEGNKGAEKIKLWDADFTIQDASSCGWNADGDVIFTDKDLITKRIKVQMELCNEDLNQTWAQLLNVAGANRQDKELQIEAVLEAYMIKKTAKKNQDLMFNGDTASIDPSLAHYDGFLKLWKADPEIPVVNSSETEFNSSNAYGLLLELYNAIDAKLFDNEENVEIIVGRETYRAVIENIYNDNNFHHTLEEEPGAEPSFILPTTNIRVRSYPQLNGTTEAWAVPYRFMFFGTDLEGDIEGFELKYDDTNEVLRFGTKWRSGVSYVYPQYFTRLRLTPTS